MTRFHRASWVPIKKTARTFPEIPDEIFLVITDPNIISSGPDRSNNKKVVTESQYPQNEGNFA